MSAAQLVLLDRYGYFGGIVHLLSVSTWSEAAEYQEPIASLWNEFHSHCTWLVAAATNNPSLDIPRVSSWVRGVWYTFGLELKQFPPDRRARAKDVQDLLPLDDESAHRHQIRYDFLRQIASRRATE